MYNPTKWGPGRAKCTQTLALPQRLFPVEPLLKKKESKEVQRKK